MDRRTLYFNDIRHFYLYTLDPPLSREQLLLPVTEAAGTSVDTFVYSVDGGNGLFYPSEAGLRYAARDERPFTCGYAWRAWRILRDLEEQGIDILALQVDEAHRVGLDFFASLRMGAYLGVDPAKLVVNGGKGLGHAELREARFAVVEELATRYPIDGVELDLAGPGGTLWHFPPDEGPKYTPVLTEYLARIAALLRGRQGKPALLGVLVYPTEEMCLRHGMDVRAWLAQGIVDWVLPMFYPYFPLDGDMPIEWLCEAAALAGVPVYGRLQPWVRDPSTGAGHRVLADLATLRGAAANFLAKGCAGIYTHSLSWPLGEAERGLLQELGDHARLRAGDKRYILTRRQEEARSMGYGAPLPLAIPGADPEQRYRLPLFVADDLAAAAALRRVSLKMKVLGMVGPDQLGLWLNGESLAAAPRVHRPSDPLLPYDGLELELELQAVRPRPGRNWLEVALLARPAGLAGGLSIEEVELRVEYRL
ncbi:MAG: hypothetical protein IT369_07315 [Candidatus Latescibacteria bacterium]|nr:hypothetical protein [Candidatus Latescibacterota bacterium]